MNNNSVFIPALEGHQLATWSTNWDTEVRPVVGWLLHTITRQSSPIVQDGAHVTVVTKSDAAYMVMLSPSDATKFNLGAWDDEKTAEFESAVKRARRHVEAQLADGCIRGLADGAQCRSVAASQLISEGLATWRDEYRDVLVSVKVAA